MIDMHSVQVGDILFYTLRSIDQPTEPDKLWHGRVKSVTVDSPVYVDCVIVDILEDRYIGETEIVYPSQIVRKEESTSEHE